MAKPFPYIKETTEALKKLLRSTQDGLIKDRIRLLYLIQSERVSTRIEAASFLGLHRNWVGKWLTRYEQGGLDALLERQSTGPKSQRTLPPEAFEALKERLDQPEGFGSFMHIQGWLYAEFDLQIHYDTLRRIIHRQFKAKPKVARPVHAKKTRNRRRLSLST